MLSATDRVLSADDIEAVRQLAEAAQQADHVAALSEQVLLHLTDSKAPVHHVLSRAADGQLQGYAQLDETATAEVVVAPAHRRMGIGRELLERLRALAAPAQLLVWSHGDHPAAAVLAEQLGYARIRVLLQLRRRLTDPLPEPSFPPGVRVRTFEPGADEERWLAVNAAAFAHHPEQGRWTRNDLEQREQLDWFDPAGFFLAEGDGELLGFHWTKIHNEETPPVGEVYVVGVRPQDAGRGLGPALTLVGLHHLRSRGMDEVLLYVEEDNVPARKTYERLGFTRSAIDVCYAAPATAG